MNKGNNTLPDDVPDITRIDTLDLIEWRRVADDFYTWARKAEFRCQELLMALDIAQEDCDVLMDKVKELEDRLAALTGTDRGDVK